MKVKNVELSEGPEFGFGQVITIICMIGATQNIHLSSALPCKDEKERENTHRAARVSFAPRMRPSKSIGLNPG